MTLRIFLKDARRLWPAILLSLAPLAMLAYHDRWRSDWLPGSTESYLNLLMPVAWALLLGLAVEQEPIAGDRQFWITRPYRRGALLTAKLLFALAFIHAPSLVADCYILASRGFAPAAYAPELLAKQAWLACALTLPALALASLVRGFTHFVLEIAAVAGAILLLSGVMGDQVRMYYLWEPYVTLRTEVVVAAAAAAAVAILALQYGLRRVGWSRGLAAAAGVGAAALFSWFLPQSALAIRATTRPSEVRLELRLDPSPRDPYYSGGRDVVLALPIEVTGVPAGTSVRIDSVRSELVAANGRRYRDRMQTKFGQFDAPPPYRVYIERPNWSGTAPRFVLVAIDPSTFAALGEGPLTLRGEAGVTLRREGPSAWMGVGESREVEGAGRCASSIVEDRYAQRIKLVCESPRAELMWTKARLWSPETGLDWKRALGDGRNIVGYPRVVWLSPLDRDLTYWHLSPEGRPGSFEIDTRLAPTARIEIIPQETLGYSVLRYEFRDLNPTQYLAKRPPNFPGALRTTPR